MCFAYDAEPPAPEDSAANVTGERLKLTSADGTSLDAYQARPASSSGQAVVILPDVRGLFAFYEQLAERFAAIGIDAVAIDYFARTAEPVEDRQEDFEFRTHVAQTEPASITEDLAAAIAHLKATTTATKVFTVGFCFGGSYSFMNASQDLGHAGAIGFYGGLKPRSEGADTPITTAPSARVPILALFGGADEGIPQQQRDEFARALADKEHEIHVYEGAPHSFFDRKSGDYAAECADAWARVRAFIQDHA